MDDSLSSAFLTGLCFGMIAAFLLVAFGYVIRMTTAELPRQPIAPVAEEDPDDYWKSGPADDDDSDY